MSRKISKIDAIIQFLRPRLQNKANVTMDVFEQMVVEAETLTTLGVRLQPGFNMGENFFVTPEELKANLDEFPELEFFAKDGRAFLTNIGYVSQRRSTPITGEGTAPVGQTVDVKPITMTLPGSEPLAGAIVTPKPKQK